MEQPYRNPYSWPAFGPNGPSTGGAPIVLGYLYLQGQPAFGKLIDCTRYRVAMYADPRTWVDGAVPGLLGGRRVAIPFQPPPRQPPP